MPRRGFSLVEILAAVSVLAILAVLIAQITSAVTRTTRLSSRAVDAASQARLAFDRIGMDLAAMVRRPDLDMAAANAPTGTASDLLLFLSRVPTPGSDRDTAFVAYQVAQHPDNQDRPCLLRAAMPVNFNDTGYFGLKADGLPIRFSDALFPAAMLPSGTGDHDVLAPGVIRMVVGFQLYPDDEPATLMDGTAVGNARGQVVYSPPVRTLSATGGGVTADHIDLDRVAAILIGIAAIDATSLQMLSGAQVSSLSGAFDLPASGQPPVAKWMADTANLSSLPSGVPLPARQAVRLFQRAYPITPFRSREP